MRLKRFLSAIAAMLIGVCSVTTACGGKKEPIVLTCWVYYNGVQEQEFKRLLQQFNDSVGFEEGILVESYSMGSISDLAANIVSSAVKEPGADPLPDLFASYADTAYEIWELGELADLSDYLSPEELALYVDAYIEEGRMGSENELCIFPNAKSTELLMLNRTAWDAFAAEVSVDESMLSTWEGIVELGHRYFDWTDAKTPEREGDGSAFFGRDAMANYMLIGSLQLGEEIFQVTDGKAELNFDRDAMRKLWDHFYVPFVNGWFGAYGRFRSDDIKTGQIIALVGSTSGAMYFPSEVTNDDGTSYPIECSAYELPNFEGTEPMATQQGAGFVVSKSTPERERAATVFLKWLTEPKQNIIFSINSGYIPVTKSANDLTTITAAMEEAGSDDMLRAVIGCGVEIVNHYRLYTNKPFQHGYEARRVLENTLLETARAANDERIALQEQGMSYRDAVAQVMQDDRFEQWYSDTRATLEQLLAQ